MLDRPINIADREPPSEIAPHRAWYVGLLALVGVGWLFWRSSKAGKPVERPMSPGDALKGWKISPADADTLRQVADADSPAGKAKLRSGPAIQR